MAFSIENTVALISGGGSGIGLSYARELLKNGARGVVLADIDQNLETPALEEIRSEFGPNKAIFVQTDVTDRRSYENAFEKTIAYFGNIDILVNNAGISNDSIWEKQIRININGIINGVLLALDKYIPKYKTGTEGVIVNISSIVGLEEARSYPIYSATKFAVIGLSKSFGHYTHFEKTKVRVLTLCPGVTDTPLMQQLEDKTLGSRYIEMLQEDEKCFVFQKPKSVAQALATIIKNGKPGSVWVIDSNKLFEYIHPKLASFAPK